MHYGRVRYRLCRHGGVDGDDSYGMIGGGFMAFLDGISNTDSGEEKEDENDEKIVKKMIRGDRTKPLNAKNDHDDNSDAMNLPGQTLVPSDEAHKDEVPSNDQSLRRPDRMVTFNGGLHKTSNSSARQTRKATQSKEELALAQGNFRRRMRSSQRCVISNTIINDVNANQAFQEASGQLQPDPYTPVRF